MEPPILIKGVACRHLVFYLSNELLKIRFKYMIPGAFAPSRIHIIRLIYDLFLAVGLVYLRIDKIYLFNSCF